MYTDVAIDPDAWSMQICAAINLKAAVYVSLFCEHVTSYSGTINIIIVQFVCAVLTNIIMSVHMYLPTEYIATLAKVSSHIWCTEVSIIYVLVCLLFRVLVENFVICDISQSILHLTPNLKLCIVSV